MKRTSKRDKQAETNDHEDLHTFLCEIDVGRGKAQRHSFIVTSFYYIISASQNPNEHAETIKLAGEGNQIAYLIFSDKLKDRPPRYNAPNKAIYINYPESYLVTVDEILRGNQPVLCQILIYPDPPHVWASVEAYG